VAGPKPSGVKEEAKEAEQGMKVAKKEAESKAPEPGSKPTVPVKAGGEKKEEEEGGVEKEGGGGEKKKGDDGFDELFID
jgi:hypothetical protein